MLNLTAMFSLRPDPIPVGIGRVHTCRDEAEKHEETNEGKFCSKCEQVKPLDSFYARGDKQGVSSKCKVCANKASALRKRKAK